MDKYQTKEIANLLEVTPTTVRRYSKDFGSHLSDGTRRKRRIFSDGDLAILKRAQELMGDGFTKRTVNEMLFTEAIAPDEPTSQLQKVFPEVAQHIEQQREELVLIRSHIDERLSKVDSLEAELAELRGYIGSPWYQRLFRRPPG